ncbi:MAG: hypothetical protein ACLPKH_13180 [Rhodomicrobium sp.]
MIAQQTPERDNAAIGSWLHEQVALAYDRLKADPSRALTVDDVRTMLAAEHRRAVASTKHI